MTVMGELGKEQRQKVTCPANYYHHTLQIAAIGC